MILFRNLAIILCFFSSSIIVYSQPVAHWTFTEMSGSSLVDQSGNGNHGQISGAIWQNTSGLRGLTFNGTSNYVSVPHKSSFNFGTGDFSIEVQFKTSVIPTGSWTALVSKHNTATWHDREFYLMIEGGTGLPIFGLSTEVGLFENAKGTTNVCDGMFHTVRGVRQGNQLRIYVDGKLQASASASINPDNSNPINIGRSSYDNGYGYFNGVISSVALWSQASPLTSIHRVVVDVPQRIELLDNYPNPFNPSTEITFTLHVRGTVRLEIFNTLGQLVEILLDQDMQSGVHRTMWQANGPSGIYLCRMIFTPSDGNVQPFVQTQKMVLMR